MPSVAANAKITIVQHRIGANSYPHQQIATNFGIHFTTVSRIVRGGEATSYLRTKG